MRNININEEIETEQKIITNSIGMKFTLIPEGEFMMGSEETDDEKPVHKVTISKPFYLGVYPVTRREWKAIMKHNPPGFRGGDLPAETISWFDVQGFIRTLNDIEGTNKYCLPSEAEWEYSARAGTITRYSFGDDESGLNEYAWYVENSGSRAPKKGDFFGYDKNDWEELKWKGKTHPVGEKKPNPWGLYDIHGNVWEWVKDKWHDDYQDAPVDGSEWEGNDFFRIVRGGSWSSFGGHCRSAVRMGVFPTIRSDGIGFRLLRIS
ncbi:MAG: formylglycine-generating enzyme family protein [Euryarchaeota archaeon]|nr:formylglycine-generating enzyme family protein [Euryarchaeota archaeon]MBU4339429.1 formylglycine-generating enzyme family protein [Euryarchaeota archaeon]MBU4454133.1 formylglycine-generating enzyme family protein [Euryarchaeota archaeon]MCG2736466.1 formylglycine-generating enzyme family protein [Candidatus Methanoperedenaceae archaeon]